VEGCGCADAERGAKVIDNLMKRIKHLWKEADALTDAEIHAAALADLERATASAGAAGQEAPRAANQIISALGLSREEFATRCHIPVGYSIGNKTASGRGVPTSQSLRREPEIVAPWNPRRENLAPRYKFLDREV